MIVRICFSQNHFVSFSLTGIFRILTLDTEAVVSTGLFHDELILFSSLVENSLLECNLKLV